MSREALRRAEKVRLVDGEGEGEGGFVVGGEGGR